MRIILVRHGETEDNTLNRMSGWTDTGLSLTGIRQAHLLAQRLKNLHIHRILSSDLNRAVKTAEIIAQHLSEEPVHEKLIGLREMNFGKLEKLSLDEIKRKYPDEYPRLVGNEKPYTFPEGESLFSFHQRVANTVDTHIKHGNSNDAILIVAHSGTVKCILSHWIIGNYNGHWRFAIDHCSLTIIENVPEFPYIQVLNDTSHFDEMDK